MKMAKCAVKSEDAHNKSRFEFKLLLFQNFVSHDVFFSFMLALLGE